MAKAVRMADIAQKLGISVVSVSKGLAGKDGVSEEMRARIVAAAKELGYAPTVRSEPEPQASANIGILVSDRFFNENAFYSALYRALLKSASKAGCTCILEIVVPEAESACQTPSILLNQKVDAILFMGEIDRRYLSAVARFGLPFLLLDFYDEAIAAESVQSDNMAGGFLVTEHLLSTGRKNIGFVGSIWATSSIMDRYLGYCKALLKAGIEPRADWRLEDRDKEGLFIPFTLPKEMPQAFVCNCDEVAFNLVERLQREGYSIPRDIAVAGYDDYRFSTICRPQLTSYRVDVDGMATAAIDQIKRKLSHKRLAAPSVFVPGALVKRDST